jgi:S1-C subfamily serine protease
MKYSCLFNLLQFVVSFFFLSGCDFPPGKKTYDKYASSFQVDLGFMHGSPYIRLGDDVREVFTIEQVVQGGVFDNAGVRPGDIVLSHQILSFYSELNESRGETFQFSVTDGVDGPPIAARSRREIEIFIPVVR